MNYIEYGTASLPDGIVTYSYARSTHGYAIKLCSDSGEYCLTSDINVTRDTLLSLMDSLVKNGISPDTLPSFISSKLTSLSQSSAKSDNNTRSKYLYL